MLYDSKIKDLSFVLDTSVAAMTKLNGDYFVGQRYYLSSGDLEGIAAIYGPPYHRLESHIDEVIDYELGGSTDKLIVDMTDSIVFYQNKECTVRAALTNARQIRIKTNHRFYMWNGEDYYTTTYQTIEIPAGTTAYHLSSWRDTEWYEESDPFYLDMWDHSIVNYHVNKYFYSDPLLP